MYLTQGLLFGIGASCMYFVVMSITPQWFVKRRGLALGVVSAGTGMGGLVFPFIATPLNRILGPSWIYRILGFICICFNLTTCLTVRARVEPNSSKKLSEIFQLNVLKNTQFLLFMIGSNISLFGYFIPFFFVPGKSNPDFTK